MHNDMEKLEDLSIDADNCCFPPDCKWNAMKTGIGT